MGPMGLRLFQISLAGEGQLPDEMLSEMLSCRGFPFSTNLNMRFLFVHLRPLC